MGFKADQRFMPGFAQRQIPVGQSHVARIELTAEHVGDMLGADIALGGPGILRV
ncbi:MAG: hypothetical protein AAFY02_00850 [Pseudomonadota bacterium]